jgi:ABC-type uncharacterized transport system permease subunit
MPIIWLRVALALYGLGLVYVLVALTRAPRELLHRIALHAAYLGMFFHFVAIVETVRQSGELGFATLSQAGSIFGFLIMVVFLLAYMVYGTTSPGIVVFPLVFLLTFMGVMRQEPFVLASETAKRGWLIAHISMIFAGYAALVLSFSASLVYLLQERALKAKQPAGILSRFPSLQVTDEIGLRSLLIGFPFMTAGLLAGLLIAQMNFGHINFRDPKILLTVLTWVVYLILLYMRWSAGWRGRKAAYLAAGTFVMAIVAWSANYFSTIHQLGRP